MGEAPARAGVGGGARGGGGGGGGGGIGGGGRISVGGVPVTSTSIADTRGCQEAHILKSNLYGVAITFIGYFSEYAIVDLKAHILKSNLHSDSM